MTTTGDSNLLAGATGSRQADQPLIECSAGGAAQRKQMFLSSSTGKMTLLIILLAAKSAHMHPETSSPAVCGCRTSACCRGCGCSSTSSTNSFPSMRQGSLNCRLRRSANAVRRMLSQARACWSPADAARSASRKARSTLPAACSAACGAAPSPSLQCASPDASALPESQAPKAAGLRSVRQAPPGANEA